MSLQLYVALQTPVIELTVKVKDVAKETDSILVGFKRYKIEESDEQMKILQEVLDKSIGVYEEDPENSSKKVCIEEPDTSFLNTFIKDHIVYIKKIALKTEDTVTKKKGVMRIEDTRTAKPVEGFWETSTESLSVLVDFFLESSPWKTSLITNVMKAIANADYEDAAAKNV